MSIQERGPSPTSPEAYAELVQETIFGANIAVKEGRMTPMEADALVSQAMRNANIAQVLGLPVETGSHQTDQLAEKWNAIRATQKAT